ncbi:MAG: hypothetical protein HYU52_13665 [Acidobacteria bacterium]|nr:hypothetical protein [Acidobacteriota bacterium]
MIVLDSGSDSPRGLSWFLVGARPTGRVFLVIVRGARTEVRWYFPHMQWQQCEPASAVEAEAAIACINGVKADGTLGWNDVERATAVWRTWRDEGTAT